MGFFTKEKLVYKEKGNKQEWQKARELLKQAGIRMTTTALPSEAPICGCGAKLDIRDFGPRGKIDRNMYYIDVAEREWAAARDVLAKAGIPVVGE